MQSKNSPEQYSARLYAPDYFPDAIFTIESDPLAYKPTVKVQEGESFLEELYWRNYTTRVIRYANTGERVLFFPHKNARISKKNQYRLGKIQSTKELAKGIITTIYRPLNSS